MVSENEAASLTARISATGVTSFKSKLRSAERSAEGLGASVDDAGGEMLEAAGKSQILSGRLEQVSDKFRGMVGSATAAAGAVAGYGTATSGAAGASATLGTVITATLVPSIIALSASAGTAATALGGIATAAGAVASGAGLVVGSGLLAYSNDLAAANRDQLQTTRAKIRALERERNTTGSLTQAQEKRLQNLREEASELEEATTKAGALSRRFGELKNTIGQQLLPVGQQFKGLIRDFVNGLPDVTQAVIDNLGPLGMFRDAIRDAGTAAAESLPRVVRGFLDIGRRAIPPLRNLAAWLGDRLPSTFAFLQNTVADVLPEFVNLGKATLGLLRDFTAFGRTVTNAVVPSITGFIEKLEGLFERFNRLPQPVQDAIAKFTVFAPAVVGAATAFVSLSSALAPIVNLFSRFIPLLVRVSGPLGALIGIALAVSRNFAGLRDDVMRVVDAFRSQLEPTIETLNRTIVPIFNDIAQAFGLTEGNIVSSIDRLATAFSKDLAGGIRRAGKQIRQGLRQIKQYWDENKTEILNTVRSLVNGTEERFTRLKTRVTRIVGDAIEAVAREFREALPRIRGNVSQIVTDVDKSMGKLIPLLRGTMQFVWKNVIQPALSAIEQLWDRHGDRVLTSVSQLTTFLVRAFRGAVNLIDGIWETWGNEITAVTKFVVDTVGSVLNAFLDGTVTLFNVFTDLLVGDWQGAWNKIQAFTQRLANGIFAFIKKWGSGFVAWFGNSLIPGIISWFEQLYQDLIGGSLIPKLFRDIMSYVVSTGLSLIEGAFQAVVDGVMKVFNLWKVEVLGLIARTVTGIADYVSSVGQSVIRGAWNTVTGAIEDVLNGIDLSGIESTVSDIISMANEAIDTIAEIPRNVSVDIDVPEVDVPGVGGVGGYDGSSDDDDDDDNSGSFGGGGGDFRNDANDPGDDGSSGFVGLHRGGVTQSSGLAMLHSNEVVMGVDAGAKALANELGGGGPTIVVRNNTFNGVDDADGVADALYDEINAHL